MGVRYKHGLGVSVTELYQEIQAKKSTTYVADSLVKFVSGLPTVVTGQTDVPCGIVVNVNSVPYAGQNEGPTGYPSPPLRPASSLASTTLGEKLKFLPINAAMVFEIDIAAGLITAGSAVSGTTTQVVVAYGGSTSDFNGGVVYIRELDWQGIVETSVVAGGNVTLVFTPPAPIAVAAGNTVDAVCFGPGAKPKLDSTNPHLNLSVAFADVSGGNLVIRSVNLRKMTANVQFPNLI